MRFDRLSSLSNNRRQKPIRSAIDGSRGYEPRLPTCSWHTLAPRRLVSTMLRLRRWAEARKRTNIVVATYLRLCAESRNVATTGLSSFTPRHGPRETDASGLKPD